MPSARRSRPASRCSRSKATSAFGFSGMEIETICRYKLPVCIVIFNNDGIYRGTDVNTAGSDPATTVFVKGSRYDKMIEAFGGVGVNATIARRAQARRQRGDGFRQADADQRGDRSGGRQRERPHRQPQSAKQASQEVERRDNRRMSVCGHDAKKRWRRANGQEETKARAKAAAQESRHARS